MVYNQNELSYCCDVQTNQDVNLHQIISPRVAKSSFLRVIEDYVNYPDAQTLWCSLGQFFMGLDGKILHVKGSKNSLAYIFASEIARILDNAQTHRVSRTGLKTQQTLSLSHKYISFIPSLQTIHKTPDTIIEHEYVHNQNDLPGICCSIVEPGLVEQKLLQTCSNKSQSIVFKDCHRLHVLMKQQLRRNIFHLIAYSIDQMKKQTRQNR